MTPGAVRHTISRLEQASALDAVSNRLQSLVLRLVESRWVRDLLHSTWLGHPPHPLLVRVPA